MDIIFYTGVKAKDIILTCRPMKLESGTYVELKVVENFNGTLL